MISGPSARASLPRVLASGTFCGAHPRELPIDEVRAHFALEHAGNSSYGCASRATAAAPHQPASRAARACGSSANAEREPRRRSTRSCTVGVALRSTWRIHSSHRGPTSSWIRPSAKDSCGSRGLDHLALPARAARLARTSCFSRSSRAQQLSLAVVRGDLRPDLLKAPATLSCASAKALAQLRRHIHRMHLAFVLVPEIQMRAMTACRIVCARAGRDPRTGESTPRVSPAPSRLRPVRVRGRVYPYYSLSRKVAKSKPLSSSMYAPRRRLIAQAIKSGTIVQEMPGVAGENPPAEAHHFCAGK